MCCCLPPFQKRCLLFYTFLLCLQFFLYPTEIIQTVQHLVILFRCGHIGEALIICLFRFRQFLFCFSGPIHVRCDQFPHDP